MSGRSGSGADLFDLGSLRTELVANLPHAPGLDSYADSIAELLHGVTEDLAGASEVLLAGSFARGTPCILRAADRWVTLSDVDVIAVYGGDALPRENEASVSERWARFGPRVTVYCLAPAAFRRLETCLGYDIWRRTVALRPGTPPAVKDAVALDPRDALELFLWGVLELLRSDWAIGLGGRDLTAEQQYLFDRITLLSGRSVTIVAGGDDDAAIPADNPLAARADAAVHDRRAAWLRGDGTTEAGGAAIAGLVAVLVESTRTHRASGWLASQPDAIAGSRFEGRPGASYAALFHQIALIALAEMADTGEWSEAAATRTWRRCLDEIVIARPAPTLTDFLDVRWKTWSESLLAMKL